MNLFINDKIIPQETASAIYFDRGLLLGDGLFETIKVENNLLLFFTAHYQRLKLGAEVLAIDFTISEEQLKHDCVQLIRANGLENTIVALRITLTRGCGPRGIDIPAQQNPNLFIHAAPYASTMTTPKSVYITNIRRNEYSPIVNLKTLNYLESILAKKQAVERGYDDGVLLNTKGTLTSSTMANIFVVIDDKIITPPLNDGVLAGIIRQHLIAMAKPAGITIAEKTISIADCLRATEIFITNSLIEIQSLACINEHQLKTGARAIVTRAVKEAYFNERAILHPKD